MPKARVQKDEPRPYHHGRLREAAIEAAIVEIQAVGAAAVRMREIARRAGVSHAALAYQFGDKAGLFTAIATEGFRLATDAIQPAANGPAGFLRGGTAYVMFALAHPAHYEVMFRPDLYRTDDPELTAARDAAFDLLYGSARAAVGDDDADVTGLVVAGWSLSHGLATLWLTNNLKGRVAEDPARVVQQLNEGIVVLGRLTNLGQGGETTDA
jgi:AcrR family transcriptional regulator